MATTNHPNLTEEEWRVLESVGREVVNPLPEMVAISGVPLKRLRVVLRELMKLDLVHFGTCYDTNHDGLRYGSGYCLTYEGSRLV